MRKTNQLTDFSYLPRIHNRDKVRFDIYIILNKSLNWKILSQHLNNYKNFDSFQFEGKITNQTQFFFFLFLFMCVCVNIANSDPDNKITVALSIVCFVASQLQLFQGLYETYIVNYSMKVCMHSICIVSSMLQYILTYIRDRQR